MPAVLAFVLLAVQPARADDKPSPSQAQELPRSETRHTIALAGGTLDYRTVAEPIGLTDQKGEPTASIFTISYLAEVPDAAKRPVAFVFNGGPGAASVFLHMGALGPRVLDTPANGVIPAPPVRVIDNPATWLAFADLVFVDPVGTGFSRGKGKEENPDKPFWNVRSDLSSLAATVRRWLTRHQRWGAPVYLVGESYGGLRAAALPRTLEQESGITVNGLVLLSPALDISLLHPDVSNALAPAFELPSFAATAANFAGKPPAAAAEAAAGFALGDYLVGLARLKGIPPEGDPFIARVAAMIGLPEDVVRRDRGRISGGTFAREFRRKEGQILSIYDGAMARPTIGNPWDDHAGDPVLDPSISAFTMAFESYAQNELGYRTEQPYRVLPRDVSQQWNWDAAREGGNGLGLALSALENTLLTHPQTRLLVVGGRYDLVTPYLGSRWLVDQLSVSEAVRAAIRVRVYDGGHMMYLRPAARTALTADAATIFAPEGAAPAH